jgi:hypothetical protein
LFESLLVFMSSISCINAANSIFTIKSLQFCNFLKISISARSGRSVDRSIDRSKTDYACWQCSTSYQQGVIDFHWAEQDEKGAISSLLSESSASYVSVILMEFSVVFFPFSWQPFVRNSCHLGIHSKMIVLDIFAEWTRRQRQYCDINRNYIEWLNNNVFNLYFL